MTERYTDNGDGTLTDSRTGLMWQESYGYSETGKYINWFDAEAYIEVWSVEQEGARLTEYIRSGENLSTWKQMISVQLHPRASRVADVMNPYAAARKPLYAAKPQIFQKH